MNAEPQPGDAFAGLGRSERKQRQRRNRSCGYRKPLALTSIRRS